MKYFMVKEKMGGADYWMIYRKALFFKLFVERWQEDDAAIARLAELNGLYKWPINWRELMAVGNVKTLNALKQCKSPEHMAWAYLKLRQEYTRLSQELADLKRGKANCP